MGQQVLRVFSDGGRTREGRTFNGGCIGRLKPNLRDMTSHPQCICKNVYKVIEFASDTGSSHVTTNCETSNILLAAPFCCCCWAREVGVANRCHRADHYVPRIMYHGTDGLAVWLKRDVGRPNKAVNSLKPTFPFSVKRSALPLVCGFGCTRGGQDSTVWY